MSEAMTPEKQIENIKTWLEELADLADTISQEREALFAGNLRELENEVVKIDLKIQALEEEKKLLRARAQVANPEGFENLAMLNNQWEALEGDIKRACKALPLNLLKAGVSIQGRGLKVSVNKPSVKTTYKTELLAKFPSLREAKYNGKPAVTQVIDPGVVEGLGSSGFFGDVDYQTFKEESFASTPPNVSIRQVEQEQS